jgi:hypothetical protein
VSARDTASAAVDALDRLQGAARETSVAVQFAVSRVSCRLICQSVATFYPRFFSPWRRNTEPFNFKCCLAYLMDNAIIYYTVGPRCIIRSS